MTLGNAASRVVASLAGATGPGKLVEDGYGKPSTVSIAGCSSRPWIALSSSSHASGLAGPSPIVASERGLRVLICWSPDTTHYRKRCKDTPHGAVPT